MTQREKLTKALWKPHWTVHVALAGVTLYLLAADFSAAWVGFSALAWGIVSGWRDSSNRVRRAKDGST